MANITFLEPGTDATGDLSFYPVTGGAASSDSGVSHTGPRSLKLFTSSPATLATARTPSCLADAGRRISFWFRTDTLPAANAVIARFLTSAVQGVWTATLKSTGIITQGGIGATGADGTKVLAANTWYRITVSFTITSTTVFRFDLFVDGVLDSSATAGTLTRVGADLLRFENNPGAGANVTNYFDDVYVDDGNDYTDPGDVRVTAKKPAANNTNNFDTAVGANPSDRWTNVNEVPLSDTNGWQHAASTDVQENYTLQAASAGDVDITGCTVLGRTAWIRAKGAAGGAGTPKIMDDGTETAVVLTASPALFKVTTTSATYPSNSAGIGMRSTNNADDTFLYECGTLIAYLSARTIPASTIASTVALFACAVSMVVAGATIASGATLTPPALAYGVAGSHIASTETTTAPSLSHAVTTPTIASGSSLSPPTVAPGAVTVNAATIASTETSFAPSAAYAVTGQSIASTELLFQPTLAAQVVSGSIGAGSSTFTPSVSPGGVAVAVAHVASTAELFGPTIVGGTALALDCAEACSLMPSRSAEALIVREAASLMPTRSAECICCGVLA